ncbi:short-chain dehydrogenase/reductase-like protein sdr [Mollisia scopiformis]|uniref:Short-chain dehydrogenase/reductase-like protein sdr n=1 Tax=Mollisia scopiformis TaxID=149040 RepID=A0A194X671_MOLSC|nr:short-chain dehydrogenase/reductase-like protein sdr [Mollisia scopiformis]KUJ15678.1 short-chain dehydrogenase/reductase-like protein sdr [Mollisia scopiformis]
MPYSLKGRNVLVTGGSRGLGELICVKFALEGCNVAVNYNASGERANGVKERIEKLKGCEGVKVVLIQGDMGKEEDCNRTVKEAISQLGGLDIIISNAGYTRFSTFSDLSAPTTEDWDTCYAVNVKANSFLLREALPTFKSNPEGGMLIISCSIAGRIPGGSSLPYAVTKAAQLHLMRCLASTQGPKVRVNAVLPGLLKTEWGARYGEESIAEMEEKAWLKRDTDIDDCAQAYIDVAKNSSLTGQRIQVDSGLGHND